MAPDRIARGTPGSIRQTRGRLGVLCEIVGDVLLNRFTLDTAERALAALPNGLMKSARRQYAQRTQRVMRLAALPHCHPCG
jgi:hypothetical protein